MTEQQQVRFCATPYGRVAYAVTGTGPLLVLPSLWVSHLEVEWEFQELRRFVAALARHHTVVRYDRLGAGLSDRPDGDLAFEDEVAVLTALLDRVEADDVALLGVSYGGCLAAALAARQPERVRGLVLFGAYANGEEIAEADLREALVATVRAHWGAGSRVLADVWLPGANARVRRQFAELQRAAASGAAAARALESVYAADVRNALGAVRAPTLVLHRRDDRAIPFALGRDLAARIPGARLEALAGDVHPPWLGDGGAVVRAVEAFLRPSAAPGASATDDGLLSDREREVLRLAADGLTNAEIAERLVLSPHTVHRHMANVRLKLGQPSRGAAAAHALRNGLI